jgi:hypothetical protein
LDGENVPSATPIVDGSGPDIIVSATPSTLKVQTKLVVVTVAGKITNTSSGIDTGRYAVIDEYGLVQAAGMVTIRSDGSYSVPVSLEAKRKGNDKDGRTYNITVRTSDRAGNSGANSTVVRVP